MFGKKKKETNYWMSYADLLTGLAIIFIIISIVLGGKLTECHGDLNDYSKRYSADSAQVAALKILDRTFSELENQTELFTYDKENNLFKLNVEIEFGAKADTIPKIDSIQLIQAGKKLKDFISNLHDSVPDVNFTVIIEGRAAKFLNKGIRNEEYNKRYATINKERSYRRAMNLHSLWNNQTDLLSLKYCDFVIAGSGFGGKGRYPYKGNLEKKNKNFIVKIIPVFKPINE